jgi:MFS family permease
MAMIGIGVAVAGLLLLDIVNTTLIQRMVPDEKRGRAMGLLQTSSAIVYSLGSLVMPIAADLVGVMPVLSASAALVVVGVVLAIFMGRATPVPAPVDAARLRLLDQPIFAGLPAGRLETAARQLIPVPAMCGDVLIEQGDDADRFYLIDSGSYRVTKSQDGGEAAVVNELGPGDVFGEIGLLRDIPRTATVTAASDGMLYALEADAFAELVGAGPDLSTRLLDLYRGGLGR